MRITGIMTYPDDRIKSIMLLVVYAVMLLYPITMFIQKEIKTEYFAVLLFLSLYGFLSGRIKPSQYSLDRSDYLVLLSFALITIIAWVSYAHFGFQDYAKHRVEKYTWFLLAIPVYYLFLYTKPRMEVVWAGVVLGCFVAFSRAMLEEFSLVDEITWAGLQGRANGSMHPIRFGDLSLLMGCIALNGSVNLSKLNSFLRLIGLVGFFAALEASILSESRGGWISLPLLIAIIIWFKLQRSGVRKNIILLFSILLIGIVVAILTNDAAQNRIDMAIKGVKAYVAEGDNRSNAGARLDMYKTACSAFLEHPLFGVGVGGYHLYSKDFSKIFNELNEKKISKEVVRWKNPHNEFLLHAATRGVVGLAALFLMMFAIVNSGYSGHKSANQEDVVFSSVNLILIAVGFSVFGLTIALFEHKDFLIFFLIYVPLFLSRLSRNVSGCG